MSSWQGRQSCLCQKQKEQSHSFRSPDHEVGESQGKRELHLGKREGIEEGHREERVDSRLKEARFQGGEGGQAKRTSLTKVGESMSR